MAEIRITGVEAFKRDLQRLDLSKRQPALVKGILRAVEPTREEIGEEAPFRSGLLSRSIVAQEDKRSSDLNSIFVDIGPTSKAFYGFFQEFGTAHMTANPFQQPTIAKNLDEIQSRTVTMIQQEIDKALTVNG